MNDWKDRPEVVQFMYNLKYQSSTIEADIRDAYENADTFDEFYESALNALEELTGEGSYIRGRIRALSPMAQEARIDDLIHDCHTGLA